MSSAPIVQTATDESHGETATSQTSEDRSEEPQNALTAEFTKAEWKALAEFRKSLPETFAESYPDKPEKNAPINLWGITIDPLNPKDDRVSVVLMKFLRARNLNVREAHTMMVATLRWRDEFNVAAAVKEEFPHELFAHLGYVYGHDKGGRPVVYNLYGANKDTKAVFSDIQRFLRWRVALMERSIKGLDFKTVDQTVQIHDYEGVSLLSRDTNTKNAASEATSIFQNHYPEFLSRKFFIHVPTILNWIFWVFKQLLSANTVAKMTVVGTGHHAIKKALLAVIDAKDLPQRYGGDAEAF